MLANDVDTVRHLIASGALANALISTADDSLLFWAIRRGHTDLVPLLLDRGANIEDRWAEGESPLMMAARKASVALCGCCWIAVPTRTM